MSDGKECDKKVFRLKHVKVKIKHPSSFLAVVKKAYSYGLFSAPFTDDDATLLEF